MDTRFNELVASGETRGTCPSCQQPFSVTTLSLQNNLTIVECPHCHSRVSFTMRQDRSVPPQQSNDA
jgi:DNA-directed RNA polymerase subunit RPC12/RpoP